MINLIVVGMVIAGICVIFFWDRTGKANSYAAMNRYETYTILAAIVFVIYLFIFIAT